MYYSDGPDSRKYNVQMAQNDDSGQPVHSVIGVYNDMLQ